MLYRRFYMWILVGLLFVGCEEPEPELSSFYPVQIEGTIADLPTRTSMSGSKASFTSGDKVGLFETLTGQSNFQYTYNGTVWTPATPAYWRNGSSTHTFYAYYPYNASYSGTKCAIPALASQTIGSTPNPAFDLLVAGPLSQTRSSGVGLTFKHGFALIQLNVKMGILALLNPYDLREVSILGGNSTVSSSAPYGIFNKTGSPSDVGYNLVTGALQADNNTSDRFVQSVTFTITGVTILYTAVTFYIFVCPGTYSNPVPGVRFKLALLGLISTSSKANFSNTTFESGKKYVYDVAIGNSLLSASAVTLAPRGIVPIDQPI